MDEPINTGNPYCDYCNVEMHDWDSGTVNRKVWKAYKCPECGEIKSDEPERP